MPPVPTLSAVKNFHNPRIILYQQTHHDQCHPISLLPLLTAQQSGFPSLTHLILAAVHLNDGETASPTVPIVTLNEHSPNDSRFTQLWDEILVLQDCGIRVMCMLGGAARGTFKRLDYEPSELQTLPPLSASTSSGARGRKALPSPRRFEQYYVPLRDFIRERRLDGIDLDVEEDMSISGIVHLIDRLRADFGPYSRFPIAENQQKWEGERGFILTLAPVATALVRGYRHLSGFDYFELERLRGTDVDWYNVQLYNGWGNLEDEFRVPPTHLPASVSSGKLERWSLYDVIVNLHGWKVEKVVVGLLTNPRHGGSGYTDWNVASRVLGHLLDRYEHFAGVMGWEYWRALPELENAAPTSRTWEQDSPGSTARAVSGHKASMNGVHEEEEDTHYWRWAWRMRWLFIMREIRDRAIVVAAGRSLASLDVAVP